MAHAAEHPQRGVGHVYTPRDAGGRGFAHPVEGTPLIFLMARVAGRAPRGTDHAPRLRIGNVRILEGCRTAMSHLTGAP